MNTDKQAGVKIVVWKDGTYKFESSRTDEFENDENWLITIHHIDTWEYEPKRAMRLVRKLVTRVSSSAPEAREEIKTFESDDWKYDYKFLQDLTYKINERENGQSLGMEEVEAVLLAIGYTAPASAEGKEPTRRLYSPSQDSIDKMNEHIEMTIPGSIEWYQPLFNYIHQWFDKSALKSDMDDIIGIVQDMLKAPTPAPQESKEPYFGKLAERLAYIKGRQDERLQGTSILESKGVEEAAKLTTDKYIEDNDESLKRLEHETGYRYAIIRNWSRTDFHNGFLAGSSYQSGAFAEWASSEYRYTGSANIWQKIDGSFPFTTSELIIKFQEYLKQQK